jgi:hypothetical protein
MRDSAKETRAFGLLYVAVHALMMLAGVAVSGTTWFLTQATASYTGDSAVWRSPHLFALMGLAVVFLGVGLAGVSLGPALMEGRPVARWKVTVVALLGLVFFPAGTAMGVYSLWYFARGGGNKPGGPAHEA